MCRLHRNDSHSCQARFGPPAMLRCRPRLPGAMDEAAGTATGQAATRRGDCAAGLHLPAAGMHARTHARPALLLSSPPTWIASASSFCLRISSAFSSRKRCGMPVPVSLALMSSCQSSCKVGAQRGESGWVVALPQRARSRDPHRRALCAAGGRWPGSAPHLDKQAGVFLQEACQADLQLARVHVLRAAGRGWGSRMTAVMPAQHSVSAAVAAGPHMPPCRPSSPSQSPPSCPRPAQSRMR